MNKDDNAKNKSLYCVKCHSVYEGESATEDKDEVVCDKCGGELSELDKGTHFDEGGES